MQVFIIFVIICFFLALVIVVMALCYIIFVAWPVEKEMKGFKSIDYSKDYREDI